MDAHATLKGTQISVLVDDALPDIIVVSYPLDDKLFRGVLLNANKRNPPCGVSHLNPALHSAKRDDDVLYAVNQRYAYIAPSPTSTPAAPAPRLTKNSRSGKMTVRLRPRQVLCSKCKDICAENSESITRKRKTGEDAAPVCAATAMSAATMATTPAIAASPPKRSANAPVTRSASTAYVELAKMQLKQPTNALSGNVNKLNIDNNRKTPLAVQSNHQANQNNIPSIGSSSSSDEEQGRLKRVILTRKKATNSNVISEVETIKTIKICYGSQGEGTVLKIPAQIENLAADSNDDEQTEENDVEGASRASRKALKKAKKEKARKKVIMASPEQSTSKYTSSYSLGNASPRYTVGSASPRHGLGNNSPRFVANLPLLESTPKKRKHKMKHKKKHKDDRDRKHKDEKEEPEKCVTQKLSINLKRLSGTYTTVPDSTSSNNEEFDAEGSQGRGKDEEESSDEVPDFPPSPLRLKLAAKHLNTALGADGVQLIVGDIVWGKLQGFPWWPGKILMITNCENAARPQASVSWYGSLTSSLIHCDELSPYLDNFKLRYNRRKRGPYKEAIKMASNEAHIVAELKSAAAGSESSSTSSPSRLMKLVPPALASPREINVIS